jgi:ribonuclease III
VANIPTFLSRVFKTNSSQKKVTTNLQKISKKLNYRFKDESRIFQALKHRSYLTETGEERIHSNERLELLGDAVLGLLVTEFLYRRFPYKDEGTLTSFKSILVSRRCLSQFAKEFGLGEHILINEAEEKSGGRKRTSILADAVEAIIGAVYLDGGLDVARDFVENSILMHTDRLLSEGRMQNYKSILLEYCQSSNLDGPTYIVEEEYGPDHDKTFIVSALVDGRKNGSGQGHSKKIAEQRAAKAALIQLNII